MYRLVRPDGRVQFTATWRRSPGAARERRQFSGLAEAKIFASARASELASGDSSAVSTLTGEENARYKAALAGAEAAGWRLDSAILDWADARASLPPGKSLSSVVREWLGRQPLVENCPPVGQVIEEFIEAKKIASKSYVHVRDLGYRLEKFAERFRCPLGEITARDVEAWVNGLPGTGPRSRSNYLGAVSNLIRFAERRGYLAPGSLNIAGIDRTRGTTEVSVFTPDQLRQILMAARPEMIPFLALGAFAGLRHAEIGRTRWEEVRDDFVEVRAVNAKTRARRLVPMLPALAAWLAPHRRSTGLVCPFVKTDNQIAKLAKACGVKWVANGLRHSFGSYRFAVIQNENQLSMEMGNTPGMVFRHYRAVVTPAQGAEWFAVVPVTLK